MSATFDATTGVLEWDNHKLTLGVSQRRIFAALAAGNGLPVQRSDLMAAFEREHPGHHLEAIIAGLRIALQPTPFFVGTVFEYGYVLVPPLDRVVRSQPKPKAVPKPKAAPKPRPISVPVPIYPIATSLDHLRTDKWSVVARRKGKSWDWLIGIESEAFCAMRDAGRVFQAHRNMPDGAVILGRLPASRRAA